MQNPAWIAVGARACKGWTGGPFIGREYAEFTDLFKTQAADACETLQPLLTPRLVAKSNLAARLSTALIGVPLIMGMLFVGPAQGWFALVGVVVCFASWELFSMTHPEDRLARAVCCLSSAATFVVLCQFSSSPRALVCLLFLVPLVGMLLPLWRLGKIDTAGLRIMAGVGGPFYVGGLFAPIAMLRMQWGESGGGLVLLTLTFAWGADTGGYFFGRFLGRRKLYEAISPKKTVEGFWGALVGAVVGGLVVRFTLLPAIPILHLILLGIVAGALGQLGDLVESLLKRSTGIKDSGSLLPGHGGILDRVDALLLVGPVVLLYLTMIGG